MPLLILGIYFRFIGEERFASRSLERKKNQICVDFLVMGSPDCFPESSHLKKRKRENLEKCLFGTMAGTKIIT